MKWYQNMYLQAGGIALVTGIVAASAVHLSTMTDGLDLRHTVKVVGIAFLGPFATLISVLPKITDILTPTVRIVSNAPLSASLAAAEEQHEIVTHAPEATVTVGLSVPPVKRSHHAAKAPVVPPVVAPIDVRSDS